MYEGVCHNFHNKLNFKDVQVLAPMVRVSTLPFRLLCLEYGADIVYGEEIIDRRISNTIRIWDSNFQNACYISKKDRTLVFSTSEAEAGRVSFQLGTADAVEAVTAATHVFPDVAAIDVNMGCPKSFS
eukprot:GHVL01022698.1.p2 GENE.GHVL01022698.1~~GHVL01022698.1.p2  ORF type:complete len:141 (-),score=22.93 GHVL01022698.1:776-1159(-)